MRGHRHHHRAPGQRLCLGQARAFSLTRRCPTMPPNAKTTATSLPNYARPWRHPFPTTLPRQHPAMPPNDATTPPHHTMQVDTHSHHVTAAAGVPNTTMSPPKGSSRRAGRRGQMAGHNRRRRGKGMMYASSPGILVNNGGEDGTNGAPPSYPHRPCSVVD